MTLEQTSPITRYYGKVCLKHPELNGERRSKNRDCVGCHRDQAHKKHVLKMSDPFYNSEYKAKKNKTRNLRRQLDEEYRKKEYERRNKWRKEQLSDPDKSATIKLYTQQHKRDKLMAKPPWISWSDLSSIYREARKKGMTVDHIVPLRNKIVCGLHVPWNLRIVTMEENRSKGNKFKGE